MAMTEAVKEAIWLKGILGQFGVFQTPVTIFCDSQSAIHLSKHQAYYDRSKHIDIKFHFVRDEVEKGTIKIEKISTDVNPADGFTKSISVMKFGSCLSSIKLMEGVYSNLRNT